MNLGSSILAMFLLAITRLTGVAQSRHRAIVTAILPPVCNTAPEAKCLKFGSQLVVTYCKQQKLKVWRRGRDSNPRYPSRYVRFRGGP
jgi:hypothetical protein